jgi:flagellar FliL protein
MAQSGAMTGDQGVSEGKAKSSLMKWIILSGMAALLAGGGFFAWTKYFRPAPQEQSSPAQEQAITYEMGSFLVNLSDPGGKRYLKVAMQFVVSHPRVGQEIALRNVEVRDMILMLLSSKEYDEIGNATGKLTLKRDLMARINKLLRDGQIKEIYFTEFLVQ